MSSIIKAIYNIVMIKGAKEQIKSLLALRGMTLKELAKLLSDKKDKKYLPTSISNKFSRGTMQYGEVLEIAEILGFEIEFKDILNTK